MPLLNISQYADHRKSRGLIGGTFPGVKKAIEDGRISLIDGKIDPEVADAEWQKNTRHRSDYHGDNADSLVILKARTEAATAALRELDLAERQGLLIDRDGAERAAFALARALRDALVETCPSKWSAELAALTDPFAVESYLRERIRAELAALCDAPPEVTG